MKCSFFWSLLVLSLLLSLDVSAQNGKIRGSIIEAETNEPLFAANVMVTGVQAGDVTDFDGNFEISLPAGTYNLQISFLGLETLTITGVQVKANDITVLENIRLNPAMQKELQEVVVTAEAIRNTESAMLSMKAKSANVIDGLSSQAFKKVGDNTAASAVKRIPGVSIQGGKYVFVRGLGDRYTKTTLHGLDIPGLDPDRNSLQMDIFPTNIISNITVLKTFTAELPADFTGGVVNIETKEFPSKPSLNVFASLGFTPGMQFNSDYLSQNASATDFLGFDSGDRDEPLGMSASNPKPTGGVVADPRFIPGSEEITRSFNPELAASNGTALPNISFGISGGDQIKKDERTYGYVGSFSYKNSTDFYEGWEQNFYRKSTDADVFELRDERLQKGNLGINNVLLSGMLGGAMKTSRSKYKVSLLHLQNGESKSGYLNQSDLIASNNQSVRDNLEYSQRSITNLLLAGEHLWDGGDWNVEWKVAPTLSNIQDKDVRFTPYLINRDASGNITDYSIDASEIGFPSRLWRNLSEIDLANRLDFTKEQKIWSRKAKLKFGLGYTFKTREYEIFRYDLRQTSNPVRNLTGDANELLSDDFIWSAANPDAPGMFIYGEFQGNNTFSGTQSTLSAYVSQELYFSQRLRAVIGVRAEKYDQTYTGQNQVANTSPEDPQARVFDNTKMLDLLDLFPSVSVVYALNTKTNLRGSFSQTTARPSFKEISAAEIEDVLSGLTFIGNVDLVQTDIQNVDLRYEIFFEKQQTLSVSGFYKSFVNPIEMVSYQTESSSIQPRNVGDARVLGIELEGRISMGTLVKDWDNFFLNTNFTLIDARVAFDKSPNGDFDGKTVGLRTGESLGDYRDMQGQAPYIINAGLSYQGKENGIEAGAYYNVQGPKLVSVGVNYTADVYSVPFHGLNVNVRKSFGKDKRMRLGLSIDNLLNDVMEMETRSYNAADKIFSRFTPLRTIGINFSYQIK